MLIILLSWSVGRYSVRVYVEVRGDAWSRSFEAGFASGSVDELLDRITSLVRGEARQAREVCVYVKVRGVGLAQSASVVKGFVGSVADVVRDFEHYVEVQANLRAFRRRKKEVDTVGSADVSASPGFIGASVTYFEDLGGCGSTGARVTVNAEVMRSNDEWLGSVDARAEHLASDLCRVDAHVRAYLDERGFIDVVDAVARFAYRVFADAGLSNLDLHIESPPASISEWVHAEYGRALRDVLDRLIGSEGLASGEEKRLLDYLNGLRPPSVTGCMVSGVTTQILDLVDVLREPYRRAALLVVLVAALEYATRYPAPHQQCTEFRKSVGVSQAYAWFSCAQGHVEDLVSYHVSDGASLSVRLYGIPIHALDYAKAQLGDPYTVVGVGNGLCAVFVDRYASRIEVVRNEERSLATLSPPVRASSSMRHTYAWFQVSREGSEIVVKLDGSVVEKLGRPDRGALASVARRVADLVVSEYIMGKPWISNHVNPVLGALTGSAAN